MTSTTAGELIELLAEADPAQRRELLDRARLDAGLETTGAIDAKRAHEARDRMPSSRPRRDEAGFALVGCAVCSTLPLGSCHRIARCSPAVRWHCPEHEHLAAPGDLEPWASPWRLDESGIYNVVEREAERARAEAEEERLRMRREDERAAAEGARRARSPRSPRRAYSALDDALAALNANALIAHESAHAAACVALGDMPTKIEVGPSGGFVRFPWELDDRESAADFLKIALAGRIGDGRDELGSGVASRSQQARRRRPRRDRRRLLEARSGRLAGSLR